MSKELEFKIFCIEGYKTSHNISGKEAFSLFEKYKVFDYLSSFYDVLHGMGLNFVIEDIDGFISARE